MFIKKVTTSILIVVTAIVAVWFVLPKQTQVTDKSGDIDAFVLGVMEA